MSQIIEIAIRPTSTADLPAVEDLLTRSKLPLDGVKESLGSFVVADQDGKLVGVAGLEKRGDYGLLRSAAVDPEWRGRGLGRALVEKVITGARSDGLRALYLLTTTAEGYFPSFGFQPTTREAVPPEIQGMSEFTTACPASAAVMTLDLRKEPRAAQA